MYMYPEISINIAMEWNGITMKVILKVKAIVGFGDKYLFYDENFE